MRLARHIFTVGKEQADKLAEAKKLRAFAVQQSAAVKKLSIEHTSLLQEVDRFKTAKAKTIKDATNYTKTFNKNRYYTRFVKNVNIQPDKTLV